MACNSRTKGAVGERELSQVLCDMGYHARRSVQYCGKAGDADVVVDEMPSVHVEVKRVQRLNIDEAMAQAVSDAAKTMATPTVWHRKNNAEWLVTVRLRDLERFAQQVVEAMDRRRHGRAHGAGPVDAG
jgi:Holliday junction resolvase